MSGVVAHKLSGFRVPKEVLIDSMRDGVYNPVPNVLMLPLSLNHTRNPADGVTYPVRFWGFSFVIPSAVLRTGFVSFVVKKLLLICLLFLINQKINHWNYQQ